jgi:hypothetical protein
LQLCALTRSSDDLSDPFDPDGMRRKVPFVPAQPAGTHHENDQAEEHYRNQIRVIERCN